MAEKIFGVFKHYESNKQLEFADFFVQYNLKYQH